MSINGVDIAEVRLQTCGLFLCRLPLLQNIKEFGQPVVPFFFDRVLDAHLGVEVPQLFKLVLLLTELVHQRLKFLVLGIFVAEDVFVLLFQALARVVCPRQRLQRRF